MVRFLEFRSENDHDSILQEIVELNGIGVQPLAFQIMDSVPKPGQPVQKQKEEKLTPCLGDRLGNR
jgi:hypothetical protein